MFDLKLLPFVVGGALAAAFGFFKLVEPRPTQYATLTSPASQDHGVSSEAKNVVVYGDGASISFNVALPALSGLEENTWVAEANDRWQSSEWLTFGNAASQRPHVALALHRARGPVRFIGNVEAEARAVAVFGVHERVFDARTTELNTTLGRFHTIRFAYELEGAGPKNCLFFHANRLRSDVSAGGFVCRSGDMVPPLAVRCVIETLDAPDHGLVGKPPEACRDLRLGDNFAVDTI